MDYIQNISNIIQNFLLNIGIYGALISCLLIVCESILPFLPLAVFITIVFYTFGTPIGLVICWVFTCLGCIISYKLCNNYLRSFIEVKFIKKLKIKTQTKIYSVVDYINELPLSSLTLLIAMPFTPAFVVNIAAGIADVDKKKYYTALFIGKLFMVYFWGTVGTSLLESLNNPLILIKVGVMLLIAYILSEVVNKFVKA